MDDRPQQLRQRRTEEKYNQTLNLSLQYSPYSFWFANVTSRLPVTDTSRYTADFRYSFGYDDWHANTFSPVYSNYGDNHFWTSGSKRHTYFEQGAITTAYKFSLPKPMEHALLINKGDAIICRAGYSWVPRYYDLESNDIRKKKCAAWGCGYTFKQHFFVRATAFWYPDSSQQQPWNGDYSYSLATRAIRRDRSLCSMPTMPVPATRGMTAAAAKFREGTISLIWFLPI